MDNAGEEILLQKLEELVFDEDKIITNSLVCEKLDLGLNESKQLLEKFVSDHQINPGKLSVTYLLCGRLEDGEYGFQMVDGVSIKAKRKLFQCINNEVVYSVQKSNVIDFNLIALSEETESCESRPQALKGSVISEKCSERIIHTKVLPPLPPQKNFDKKKPSSFFKPVPKAETNGDVKKVDSQSNGDNAEKKKEPVTKKAGGLAGFLNQPSQNFKKKHSSSEEDVKEVKKVKLEESEAAEKKLELTRSNDLEKDPIVKTVKEEVPKSKPQTKKTPKKTSSKKEDQDGRKRKRIIVESDSEDDMFGKDEDEKMDVIESDEEKLVETKPKAEVPPVPKNKRRKAVEKTYEDEDGYIVTRTEYVLVSASEDEEEKKPSIDEKNTRKAPSEESREDKKSPPVKSNAKTKKGKTVAANQPTLMNFFKKK